jgi:dihydroorotate dehydrogenase
MNPIRHAFLLANDIGYRALRPLLFRQSAQDAHERVLTLLQDADNTPHLLNFAALSHRIAFQQTPITVGGTTLAHPFILAAGFVKGKGFADETRAIEAVESGENIIPGWRAIPQAVGLVEYGSYTRQPRLGNDGTVIWRDVATHSTQNRIGLKNPGAVASAMFFQKHLIDLPQQFGINIAVSPGVDDRQQQITDIREALQAFLSRAVVPNWFTLNISCPNTEDDPSGNQTNALTRALCQNAIATIEEAGYRVPLWVKISPGLARSQYAILMRAFAETGVQAVIATNTLSQPTPDNPAIYAGVGGGRLYQHALQTVDHLLDERYKHDYPMDIIGCGGIIDRDHYLTYKARGITVVQYWSALIYRGLFAAALIRGGSHE